MSAIGGPAVITSGLVLELDAGNVKSYQSGSTTWFDKSGNARNGTLTNGPTFNTGSLGSIVFDGVDDYVTGSFSTLNDFTISCYVKSNDITSALRFYPIGLNFSGSAFGGGIWFGGSFAPANTAGIYDGNTFITGSSGITTNTWTFVTVTRQSSTSTVYINNSTPVQGSISSNPIIQYTIGKRTDNNWPYNGNISLIQVYNRALSASEVQQNFNATRARFGI
jgi:hypothetical protein